MPQSAPRRRFSDRQHEASAGRPRPGAAEAPSTASASQIPGLTILPLRLFLGITFVYAGVQKLADPGFLRPGASTYIGSQLLAFSRGSPIRTVLHQFMGHAVAVGWLTIATELAIGILILVGLLTRPAALVGLILNAVLFLSASWHSYPYFYGSDIVFVVCWLTLALTGAGPFALDTVAQPRLYNAFGARVGSRAWEIGSILLADPRAQSGHGGGRAYDGRRPALLTRAEALAGAGVTALLIVLGLVPRSGQGATTSTLSSPSGSSSTPSPSRSTSTPVKGNGSGATIPQGAKKIGNVSQLPLNTSGTVADPKTGDPAVIIHGADSKFYAYDAVCTHAGCTVSYDPQQRLLVCPCHGGEFDPARGAEVVSGPPPSPLSPIQMAIDGQGNIYIV